MPKEYYSNMLALRADIQLIYKLLSVKDPALIRHFAEVSIDMSLITVESFLTLYTNTCHPEITEVIIDHFLVQGPVVLLKVMVLLLSYMRKQLLETTNIGTHSFNSR